MQLVHPSPTGSGAEIVRRGWPSVLQAARVDGVNHDRSADRNLGNFRKKCPIADPIESVIALPCRRGVVVSLIISPGSIVEGTRLLLLDREAFRKNHHRFAPGQIPHSLQHKLQDAQRAIYHVAATWTSLATNGF